MCAHANISFPKADVPITKFRRNLGPPWSSREMNIIYPIQQLNEMMRHRDAKYGRRGADTGGA